MPTAHTWLSAMCHQEPFTNGRFMAMKLMVLNDDHVFSSYILGIKKPHRLTVSR
jgi:hypothetical protein